MIQELLSSSLIFWLCFLIVRNEDYCGSLLGDGSFWEGENSSLKIWGAHSSLIWWLACGLKWKCKRKRKNGEKLKERRDVNLIQWKKTFSNSFFRPWEVRKELSGRFVKTSSCSLKQPIRQESNSRWTKEKRSQSVNIENQFKARSFNFMDRRKQEQIGKWGKKQNKGNQREN